MNWVILRYELGYNHPYHPQPPSTTQKLPKKAKTCHIQLFYSTLDVNTETGVDFDSDMKQWCIYMRVCVCVYIFYKTLYLLCYR